MSDKSPGEAYIVYVLFFRRLYHLLLYPSPVLVQYRSLHVPMSL